ncbi:MAG: tripartite tricarboxylate transporter substrate binding protein [Bradyrhizobiaceae bacterium]|nr:tripartite tricarboxylate transporter substrate binding protein [Bradyrhizobiaceae bacterium]
MKKIMALALLAAAAGGPAMAQSWPTQPVSIVVGFGPGSTPDLVSRVMSEQLKKRLGQPFVVLNRPGAGGNIGLETVAKAAADGYTIGTTIPGPLIVNPMTMKMSFDSRKDIRPVTILATQPSVLVVNAKLGVDNLKDLIALLKANPGKYNYSSIGIGSISHLSMELVAQQSGTQIQHIPYKSSPEAVAAVIAGETHMATLAPNAVTGHAESGTIRMIAVSTPKRWPALPDVPTFAEQGIEGVQAEAWMAMVAPAGTPDAIIERLYKEVKDSLESAETREQMKKFGFEPVGITPAEFAKRIEEEEKRWAKVVDQAGLRAK